MEDGSWTRVVRKKISRHQFYGEEEAEIITGGIKKRGIYAKREYVL